MEGRLIVRPHPWRQLPTMILLLVSAVTIWLWIINDPGIIIALVGTLLSVIFTAMNHLFSRLGDVLFLLAGIAISVGLLVFYRRSLGPVEPAERDAIEHGSRPDAGSAPVRPRPVTH